MQLICYRQNGAFPNHPAPIMIIRIRSSELELTLAVRLPLLAVLRSGKIVCRRNCVEIYPTDGARSIFVYSICSLVGLIQYYQCFLVFVQ